MNAKVSVHFLVYVSQKTERLEQGYSKIHYLSGGRYNVLCKVYGILRIVWKLRPDVIHTHHTLSGAAVKLLSPFCGKSKIVTTVHTDLKRLSFVQQRLAKFRVNNLHGIIFNSNETMLNARQVLRVRSKIKQSMIYNGIDAERILMNHESIRLKYEIQQEEILIGSIGRLEIVKDHRTTLNAFKMLYERFPNCKLIIVGGGTQDSILKESARLLGIQDRVIFTGSIPKDDAYKVLNSLDLFLITSKYEGFGNAIIEAAFAKKPIISSDIPTLKEVTANMTLYFSVGDSNNLSETIISALKTDYINPENREILYQYVKTNYSIENQIERYIKFYNNL
jgi:glycosyltransferase involved in cell wall biosynthesis